MNSDCKFCAFNVKATNTLNDESFEYLSLNHAIVNFNKGEQIIRQGTFSTNVIFLRTGLVMLHISGPKHEQIVKLVKAPTYLGLPTTFGNKMNQYSVTALSEVAVCFIDLDIFKKILRENEKFAYEIIVELCKNELESFRRCANRTQKQARGNIATFLLELSDNIYLSNEFILPLSQTEIANLADTSRESVSRILNEFARDNVIELKGKSIKIANRYSLELISKNG